MAESGEDIRGEDAVEAAQPQPFTVRFHLHPNVSASLQQDGEAVLLRLPTGRRLAPAGRRRAHLAGGERLSRRARAAPHRAGGADRPRRRAAARQMGRSPRSAEPPDRDENRRSHQRRFLAAPFPAADDARRPARAATRWIGVSADGPLLDEVRADGFRVGAGPLPAPPVPHGQRRSARRSPRAPCCAPKSRTLFTRTCRSAASSAASPRVSPACRASPTPATASCSTSPAVRCAAARGPGDGAGSAPAFTDVFTTVSTSDAADARRLHIWRDPVVVGNGRDPAVFRPDPDARRRIRAELDVPDDAVVVVAVSRLVADKGYWELAAAMRDVADAMLWVVGERLAVRPRGGHRRDAPTPPASARACAASAIGATCRRCWPPPTSSACRAITRLCRCR